MFYSGPTLYPILRYSVRSQIQRNVHSWTEFKYAFVIENIELNQKIFQTRILSSEKIPHIVFLITDTGPLTQFSKIRVRMQHLAHRAYTVSTEN